MSDTSVFQEKPWLKSYADGVKGSIEYEDICITEFFDRTVIKHPNNIALNFQGYKIKYIELEHLVSRFASFLDEKGIKKGDRVSILLPNVIHCVVAFYAVLKVGGIAVMANPLNSDRELKQQFTDSGSKLLVTLDLLVDRMVALRKTTLIENIVYCSIGDYLPFPKNLLFPLVAKKKGLAADIMPARKLFNWKEVIKASPPFEETPVLSLGDIAIYQYTGGTTGISKGAKLTHANLSYQLQQIKAWFPQFQDANQINLGALPFFHIFGLTVAMNLSVYMGWENVLVPKPQPAELLGAIKKHRPTFAALVPTMFIGMMNHEAIDHIDMSSINACFSGSAPLPVEVIRSFEDKTGSIIVEGFGLTEASPVTHVNPLIADKRKVGSVGIPIPDTECRIVDIEEGINDVTVGEAGELIVKGPQVMIGYRNRPEETEISLRDGWLYTGDIARMDEDGYFYIIDRKKDVIISGGVNVYPREIDEVVYENPKVKEACAVGISHPVRGESVKLFVVLKEGEEATVEEIIGYCSLNLARYKLPVEIEFRDELPKSSVGKILRKELREEERLRREKKKGI